MCEVIGAANQLSRRRLLQGAGAAVLAGATLGGGGEAADAAWTPSVLHGTRARRFRTRLVLLGVAGGPVWYADVHGIGSAVVVGDARYVVDCGEGVWRQYLRAGLGGDSWQQTLAGLRGVFLTHLHSDHVVDYPALWLFANPNGLNARTDPVHVYGPGDRGSLPPLFGPAPAPPVINPGNPTPGVVDMSSYLLQAFATDFNDRMRDSRNPDIRTKIHTHDIPLPSEVIANANSDPAPRMEPIGIFEDDHVKVTATLVDHRPSFPSFAYRFDTDDGAIAFSGDTAVSPNLIRLARGADVLVHECIDAEWVNSLFPEPHDETEQAIINHLLQSHTTIEQVGKVAERAGVKTLVLSHVGPVDNPERRWREASRDFSGELIVGRELMQVGVGAASR